MKKRGQHAMVAISTAAVVLAGCATQPAPGPDGPPGFFLGLVHGFFILFSFIGSLFTEYRIYAFPNAGGWYDFGFLLGAMAFLGGGGSGASKAQSR